MVSIKLKNIAYIDTEDVDQLIAPARWNDCEFAQMAENDSYVRLDCSDYGLEELYKYLDWEVRKGNEPRPEDYDDPEEYEWKAKRCYAARLRNQINLVERLRKEYGIRYEILVWVSW